MSGEAEILLQVLAAELAAVEHAIATGGPIPPSASLALPEQSVAWTDEQRVAALALLARLDGAIGGVAVRMEDVAAALQSLQSQRRSPAVGVADTPLFLDIRV